MFQIPLTAMKSLLFGTLLSITFALLACSKSDNGDEKNEIETDLVDPETEETDKFVEALVAFQRGEAIYIMADGDKEKRIAKGTNPCVSPDGKKLAYTKAGGSGNDFTREIFIVDLETGKEEKLNVQGNNYYGPMWSPDGKHISFSYFTGSNWEIGIINSDNSGFRTTEGNDDLGLFSPTWHPDGQSIVAHNMSDIIEFDLNGESIRGVNIDKIISEEYSISSSTRFWITEDREYLFFNAEVDEYRDDLEGPLEVIAFCNLDTNETGRVSPPGLYATDLCVTGGLKLLFDGFKENQETSDIYRYDFHAGKMGIVVRNATEPSSTL